MVSGAGWPQQSAVSVESRPVARDRERHGVRAVRDFAVQLAAVAGFFVAAVSANAWASVASRLGFQRDCPAYWQDFIRRLFRSWLAVMDWCGCIEVDFPEAEKLAGARGLIIAANHPSLIDALVFLGKVPRGVCIMRSSDLRRNPALSALSRLAGYIPNDKGAELVRGGLSRLAQGSNLIIFPEGTRTRGVRPGPFKRAFAMVATRSGATVQTVFLRLESPLFRKGVSLLRPVPLPVHLEVRLGRRMKAEPGETARDFAWRVENYFIQEAPSQPTFR